jgi:hypothetical protein
VSLGTTRLLVAAVSVTVLVLSIYLPPNVFWIMLFIGTVFASSWGPVGFMSIWSRRITADGRLLGHGRGPARQRRFPPGWTTSASIDLPSYLDPALLGTVAGFLSHLLGVPGDHALQRSSRYLARLHRDPRGRSRPQRTRVTLIAPALLVLYGLCMPFLLLHFYVKPYQRGSGTILRGGRTELEPGGAVDRLRRRRCCSCLWGSSAARSRSQRRYRPLPEISRAAAAAATDR